MFMNNNEIEKSIKNKLSEFQYGYIAKDLTGVDAFIQKMFGKKSDNAQIIGTDSRGPMTPEWCNGAIGIREIIVSDWEGWGDLRIDISGATIHVDIDGKFSWVGMAGTLKSKYDSADVYLEGLKNIKTILSEEKLSPKLKLLKIEEDMGAKLFGAERGDEYVWPVKISAVLKNENNEWFFKQIHFSFPANIYPIHQDLKTCLSSRK